MQKASLVAIKPDRPDRSDGPNGPDGPDRPDRTDGPDGPDRTQPQILQHSQAHSVHCKVNIGVGIDLLIQSGNLYLIINDQHSMNARMLRSLENGCEDGGHHRVIMTCSKCNKKCTRFESVKVSELIEFASNLQRYLQKLKGTLLQVIGMLRKFSIIMGSQKNKEINWGSLSWFRVKCEEQCQWQSAIALMKCSNPISPIQRKQKGLLSEVLSDLSANIFQSQSHNSMIHKIVSEITPANNENQLESLIRAESIVKSIQMDSTAQHTAQQQSRNRIIKQRIISSKNRREMTEPSPHQEHISDRKTQHEPITVKQRGGYYYKKRPTYSSNEHKSYISAKSARKCKRKKSLDLFSGSISMSNNGSKGNKRITNTARKEEKLETKLKLKYSKSNNWSPFDIVNSERREKEGGVEWKEIQRISNEIAKEQIVQGQGGDVLKQVDRCDENENESGENESGEKGENNHNNSRNRNNHNNNHKKHLEIEHSQISPQLPLNNSTSKQCSRVWNYIDYQLATKINSIGESINDIKQLLQQSKQKPLIPIFLLYKKFFYLRTALYSNLCNNRFHQLQQNPFKQITKQQWKEIQQSNHHIAKLSELQLQNNCILKNLQKLYEKVLQKLSKQKYNRRIFDIVIDDDRLYQEFITVLVKVNMEKYLNVRNRAVGENKCDLGRIYNYGRVIMMAVADELEDEGRRRVEVEVNKVYNGKLDEQMAVMKRYLCCLYT